MARSTCYMVSLVEPDQRGCLIEGHLLQDEPLALYSYPSGHASLKNLSYSDAHPMDHHALQCISTPLFLFHSSSVSLFLSIPISICINIYIYILLSPLFLRLPQCSSQCGADVKIEHEEALEAVSLILDTTATLEILASCITKSVKIHASPSIFTHLDATTEALEKPAHQIQEINDPGNSSSTIPQKWRDV